MLTISGRSRRFCDGATRRDFLRIGAAGIGGLALADVLRADALAGPSAPQRSIINIYLPGGPSHMDTFDLKPEAPAEFRGEFQPIPTNVSGVYISEHFPRLAKLMDKLAIVRSVANWSDEHDHQQSDSGWSQRSLQPIGGRPSLGSVVTRLQGASSVSAPPFVQLSGNSRPGFLGPVYSPYRPDGPGRENLSLSNVSLDRLNDRAALLGEFDRIRREVDHSGMMRAMDTFGQRAVDVVTSNSLAKAFDIRQEDPRVRERYGLPPEVNQSVDNFLLARRLVEAGVRCVSLWWGGWDTHGQNFVHLKRQLPDLDRGLSALIEDLDACGRLDSTLILMSGEFGRTPRINNSAGRDHWSKVGFAMMAGGGLKTGQVIGSTNRLGEFAVDRPINIQEVFATLYHQLHIDPATTTLMDPNGRPQYLVDMREPIRELV